MADIGYGYAASARAAAAAGAADANSDKSDHGSDVETVISDDERQGGEGPSTGSLGQGESQAAGSNEGAAKGAGHAEQPSTDSDDEDFWVRAPS